MSFSIFIKGKKEEHLLFTGGGFTRANSPDTDFACERFRCNWSRFCTLHNRFRRTTRVNVFDIYQTYLCKLLV